VLLSFNSGKFCRAKALSSKILKLNRAHTWLDLDYNVLKLRLLRLLSKAGPTDSDSLARTISASKDFGIDIHALRMALMRYHKQGLLKREKVGGLFRYTLTERGDQRLRWLEQQAVKKKS